MKRTIGAFAGSVALGLSVTAVAAAASAPTATTGAATGVNGTSAVLHGHVNPHGTPTDYAFDYGPTAAYGAATVARRVGSGIKAVAVSQRIAGLAPGTVYHYVIVAVTPSGQVIGHDATFKTTGAPPSAAVTGPPVNVRKTIATPTGSINPNGTGTRWVIQYGLSAAYGLQTFPQGPIPAGFTAVPVSLQLSGLAPATLFHYRVVAYHGATATYGGDATFFTEPDRRPSPSMTTRTRPGADRRAPYRFTTSGTLRGGGFIPAAQRCTGTVGIRYFNGRHQLAYVVAGVTPTCSFSDRVSFRRTHGRGSVPVHVSVFYRGNGYLASQRRTDHVRAGR